MRATTIPKILIFLMLAGMLVACSDLQKNAPSLTPVEEQSTPVEEPTPSPVNMYLAPIFVSAETPVPEDWLTLDSPELGIHFRFPPLPGEIIYEYNNWPEREGDPTGILVKWVVERKDPSWGFGFAACESVDMQVGRERTYTDITSWFFDETLQKYIITYPLQRQAEVQPLRVVTRIDGLQGIIFTPRALFDADVVGTSAVLSLPEGYLPKIKVISFYFANQESLDEIEAVLKSVSLTNTAFGIKPDSTPNLEIPKWIEYRDARYGYGLVVPSEWLIYPTPAKGEFATFVMANFGDGEEGRGISSEEWPKGGLKIDITVVENIDTYLSLTDAIYSNLENELAKIVSVQEEAIANHSGIASFSVNKEHPANRPHKRFNLFLPPGYLMSISVLPEEGWDDPDIKTILNSLAFQGAEVVIPSLPHLDASP